METVGFASYLHGEVCTPAHAGAKVVKSSPSLPPIPVPPGSENEQRVMIAFRTFAFPHVTRFVLLPAVCE